MKLSFLRLRPRPLAAALALGTACSGAVAAPWLNQAQLNLLAAGGLLALGCSYALWQLGRSLRQRRRAAPWPRDAWQAPPGSRPLLGLGAVMLENAGLDTSRLRMRLPQDEMKQALQNGWGITDGDGARRHIDDLVDAAREPECGQDRLLALLRSGRPLAELQSWLAELYGQRGYIDAAATGLEPPDAFSDEEAARSGRIPPADAAAAAGLANFLLLQRGCASLAQAREHLAQAASATEQAHRLAPATIGQHLPPGELSTAAYDLERAAYLARVCTNLGYLHPREAWCYLQRVGLAAQRFADWDTYLLSLLYGRGIWLGVNAADFAAALSRYRQRRHQQWKQQALPGLRAAAQPGPWHAERWSGAPEVIDGQAWALASLCVELMHSGEAAQSRALLEMLAQLAERHAGQPRVIGLHAWALKELCQAQVRAAQTSEAAQTCKRLELLCTRHPESAQAGRNLALAAAHLARELAGSDSAAQHVDELSALLRLAERSARRFPHDPVCAGLVCGIAADLVLLYHQAEHPGAAQALFQLAAEMEARHPGDLLVAQKLGSIALCVQSAHLAADRLHKARDMYNHIALLAQRFPGDLSLARSHGAATYNMARTYLQEELPGEAHEMRSVLAGIVARRASDADLAGLEVRLDRYAEELDDGQDGMPHHGVVHSRALH